MSLLPSHTVAFLCFFGSLFAEEYLQHDSRRLSQAGKAVVITDLSKVEPASALITGKRQKMKWKMIPFETAEMKGTALSIYSATNPPVVRLPLTEKGWHAVYVGLATTSGGFNIGGNGFKTKLSDEPVFRRMANNLALMENRRAVIQECFADDELLEETVAELLDDLHRFAGNHHFHLDADVRERSGSRRWD